MFKKLLLTSIISGLLLFSISANAQTFSKAHPMHKGLTDVMEYGVKKPVSINFGSTDKNSKITIKKGTCDDYFKVARLSVEGMESPNISAETKVMLSRIAYAAGREFKKMKCKR